MSRVQHRGVPHKTMWYLVYFLTHRWTYRILISVQLFLVILIISFLVVQKDRLFLLSRKLLYSSPPQLVPKVVPAPLSLSTAARSAGVSMQRVGAQYCVTGSMKRLGFFVWLVVTSGAGMRHISYTRNENIEQLKVTP